MYDLIYNFIMDFIFGNSNLDTAIISNACSIITIIILCVFVVLLARLVMWAFYIVYKPFKRK